jgi:hypothetical protein
LAGAGGDVRKNPRDLHCFVISPIGRPGSEAFRKANAVLGLVREAAAEACRGGERELVVYRGEESHLTGDVLRSIVMSLLEDDLIVGVLFNENPNVFMELGIAETLGRPVLLLKERGFAAPFDIKMFRSVPYSPDLYETGTDLDAKAELVERIRDFLVDAATAPVCKVPFHMDHISPPARTYPLDRSIFADYGMWSRMLLDAQREIWVAGTTLWEIVHPKKTGFEEPVLDAEGRPTGDVVECHLLDILAAMLLRGVSVNIVTMDEGSPCLVRMMGGAAPREREVIASEARDEIVKTHAEIRDVMGRRLADAGRYARYRRPGGRLRLVKVADRTLTHRVMLTEKIGYVTPIFYTRTDINSGPCFRVTPKSNFEIKEMSDKKYARMSLYSEVLNDLKLHMAENRIWEISADDY